LAFALALPADAQDLTRMPDGRLMTTVLGKPTELKPSKFCIRGSRPVQGQAPDASACAGLDAAEFAPLDMGEFIALHDASETLSQCVLAYEVRNPKPDFFGNNMDDKLWRQTIKSGKARDMFVEASGLPDFIGRAEVDAMGDRELKKRFPEVIWALLNYAMGAERTQVEAVRAKAIYAKYTAMGTKGECVPGETFDRLLAKAGSQ
jgi:hypothetical protein